MWGGKGERKGGHRMLCAVGAMGGGSHQKGHSNSHISLILASAQDTRSTSREGSGGGKYQGVQLHSAGKRGREGRLPWHLQAVPSSPCAYKAS